MTPEEQLVKHQVLIDNLEKKQEKLSIELKEDISEVKTMIIEQIKKQEEHQEKVFNAIKLEEKIEKINAKVDKSLTNSEINKSKFTTIYRGIAIFLTGVSVAVAIMKLYQG